MCEGCVLRCFGDGKAVLRGLGDAAAPSEVLRRLAPAGAAGGPESARPGGDAGAAAKPKVNSNHFAGEAGDAVEPRAAASGGPGKAAPGAGLACVVCAPGALASPAEVASLKPPPPSPPSLPY